MLEMRVIHTVRKHVAVIAACIVAPLTIGGPLCAPAQATEAHAFSSSFDGGSEHPLSNPDGVAVNQTSGDVYVVDRGHDKVDIFSSSGALLSTFGAQGSAAGDFEEPTEIAVDNSPGTMTQGDVYVTDGGVAGGANRIEVFNAGGQYLSEISREKVEKCALYQRAGKAEYFQYIDGLAVDPSGNLWIQTYEYYGSGILRELCEAVGGGSTVQRVTEIGYGYAPGFAAAPDGDLYAATTYGGANPILPDGELQPAVCLEHGEPEASALAVATNEDLYIERGNSLVIRCGGERAVETFGNFGANALGYATGMAIKGAGEQIYVADTAKNRVDVFTWATEATVALDAPTEVKPHSVVLHGTVNPEGSTVTSCVFEYSSGGAYSSTPCAPAPGSGTNAVAVSAGLSGLASGTSYSYRILATDEYGSQKAEGRFETEREVVAPSQVTTGEAQAVEATSAKLTGAMNPGEEADYYFEYGEAPCNAGTQTCGAKTAVKGPVFGKSAAPVPAIAVSELKPGTTYHYWLVAENTAGTVHGEEHELITKSPTRAEPFTGPAEAVTAGGAKLTGELDPGVEATYYFEYGEAPCDEVAETCGLKTASSYVAGESKQPVPPVAVNGLHPETTYHYWLVAENTAGRVRGQPGSFETAATATGAKSDVVEELVTQSGYDATTLHDAATLHARVLLHGAPTTAYFQYGDDTTNTEFCTPKTCLEAPAAPGRSIGAAGQTGKVELPIGVEGLAPGTVYHYRVVVISEVEVAPGEVRAETVYGADQTFTTPGAPQGGPIVEEASVTSVGATAATLHARLEPDGAATSVYFQYGPVDTQSCTPTTCAETPEPPGEPLGSGGEAEAAGRTVQGLAPGTVYHYRAVAVGSVEGEHGELRTVEVDGPDETFQTQTAGAFALPDDRRWEMVSPPEKLGARIAGQGEGGLSEGNVIQAAANGNAITFVAYSPTEANTHGYSGDIQVFAARTPSGWTSWDLSQPHEVAVGSGAGKGNEYRFFSEDLSTAVLQPFGAFTRATPEEEAEPLSPKDRALAPDEASEQTAFVHTNYLGGDPAQRCERPRASCYRPIVTSRPGGDVSEGTVFGEEGSCPPETFCGPEFQGASPNGEHVVIHMRPTPGLTGLYEWTAGSLTFVAEHAELGSLDSKHTRHAVSSDGSRVFYAQGGNLFMRDLPDEATVELDLPEAGCAGCEAGHGIFQTASSDGTRVFFTDSRRLTADSGATESGRGLSDLYECRIVIEAKAPRCELSDLTPLNKEGEHAAVQGQVLGASEDGSWVYYVADGVLESGGAKVPGAVAGGCLQETGLAPSAQCNLYVSHGGETKLVAVIAGADNPDWGAGNTEVGMQNLIAGVSPNGEWLAFMSKRELTGYNNHDAVDGQPDEEAYVYDGRAEKLSCVSCLPTGALPQGQRAHVEGTTESSMPLVTRGVWESDTWLSASLPGWTPHRLDQAAYQSRFMSNNGRLYFDSYDALAPQDANGTWDVYEYEPASVGSCSSSAQTFSERAGGCISAVSSGTAATESAFLDASGDGGAAEGREGGKDVFFLTGSQLTAQDKDNAYDVYDARECVAAAPCAPQGGEPSPPCESADGCRAAPTPEPSVFGTPASATFSRAGNLVQMTPAKPKTAAQVRAEKLARALKSCSRKRRGRAACEAAARRRYGQSRNARRKKRAKKSERRRTASAQQSKHRGEGR